MKKVTAIILCAFTLSACEQGSNEGFGTFLGMLGGAVVGSAIAGNGASSDGKAFAMMTGAVVGAAVGNNIGKKLDEADRIKMYQAQQVAFESYPSGQASSWYNPDSGNSGSYTPRPAAQNDNGQYCREYQQTVKIGGEVQDAYGKACRQPDGSWKIVNDRI